MTGEDPRRLDALVRRAGLVAVVALALAGVATPSNASPGTYRRRFVNHLSRVVVCYRYSDGAWREPVVVWPGLSVEQVAERRSGTPPDLWGMDISGDGDIDLTRHDFGTGNWVWRVGENIPR